MGIWNGLLTALGEVLKILHDLTVGIFGEYAWVSAIVLLTVLVRLALLPLAVRQFRSMQKMQQLRPEMKRIQGKYKADRSMMRTDPEKYRAKRQKQQEELMALYKEHDVNPAASCLPLVAQAPIFIALFSVLRSPDVRPELVDATFVGQATLQQNIAQMFASGATGAAIVAIVMLLAMGATTFLQQKQMMGRQATVADDQQMQQQKLMMYIMPVFLGYLSWTFPIGVVLYWVTTNVWTIGQQAFIFKQVEAEEARAAEERAQRRLEAKGKRGAKGSERGQGTDSGSEDTTPKKSKPTPSKGDRGSEGGSGNARNAKGNGTNGGRSGNGRSQDGRSQNSPAQNGRKRTPNGKVNGTKSSRSNKPDSSQGTPKATQ